MKRRKTLPRLMIAATGSGTGKTTVVCGLIAALASKGMKAASFKCGPDYIDPMFHTEILGAHSRNLDLFFSEEEQVRQLLLKNGAGCDIAVMEGVMGYYDGLSSDSTHASAWHLASASKTPTVLLVSGKGMALSIAAVVKGFAEFRRDSQVSGVILNRVSPGVYPAIKKAVEQETGIPVLGYLPSMPDCGLESRHLGLVTATEVSDLKERISKISEQLKRSVDLSALIQLANSAPPLECAEDQGIPLADAISDVPLRIGLAKDRAFCFYYQDSLDLLTSLGAELIPFSPVCDPVLPEGLSGLLLGGGYPELYAEELSANASMRECIRTKLGEGLPCIAECGGFLYLLETLEDESKTEYPMAGVLPGKGFPTGKLSRFGYVTLTAEKDGLLCDRGEQIRAHEFHYWDSTDCGGAFLAEKPSGKRRWDCVHFSSTLYAGFPHLYLWSNPRFAVRFLQACERYRQIKRTE